MFVKYEICSMYTLCVMNIHMEIRSNMTEKYLGHCSNYLCSYMYYIDACVYKLTTDNGQFINA